jgi:shikimate kinase
MVIFFSRCFINFRKLKNGDIMKKIVKSPGSATIINAISTGYGSAFGIKLYVTAEAKVKSSKIKCSTDKDVSTLLMELCVKKVLEKFNIETGISVKTYSNLPIASGLSSSSATSNAVVLATISAITDYFQLKPGETELNDLDILDISIDASLEAGVTITGAFDDASASYFGGLTLTDNINRRILKKRKMEDHTILIYVPSEKSLTAQSNVKRMKLLAPWVNLAFKEALKGDIYNAMTLNGILYSAALGFNPEIALEALDAGAIASGLSGTGPSFVAIVDKINSLNVKEAWKSYPGKIIDTKVDNEGTKVVNRG